MLFVDSPVGFTTETISNGHIAWSLTWLVKSALHPAATSTNKAMHPSRGLQRFHN